MEPKEQGSQEEAPPQWDGGPTYSNGESTVWYDTDGEQHTQ